jgi:adenylosuccinate lyase
LISRYTRPEMGRIWADENKFRMWLAVEVAATETLAEAGLVPREAAQAIRDKGDFNLARIHQIEEEVKHDVIAFTTAVAEKVGPQSRWLHYGLTSNDVVDTAQALQIKEASELILKDLKALRAVLKRRAFEFKDTPMIGRTHGIHAEPITFGLKLANWYSETERNIARFERTAEEMRVGKLSGAVGTFAHLEPEYEVQICERLGLKAAEISSQVIQRDRHATYVSTLAVIAATLDMIATEIRHLQRTEVREAEEFFSEKQKGSSAMPHKRNPVLSENLTGLARLVRSHVVPALENVALWHERDISHSSVERVIAPDATIALDFALARLTTMMDRLLVYPEAMKRNLDKLGGLHNSQRVLLALTQAGMAREDAYRAVQRNATRVWEGKGDFATLLKSDKDVAALLPPAVIDAAFDDRYHVKHVDAIFRRVFGSA